MIKIREDSHLPKYAQLKSILKDSVLSGKLADKLPGETHIAKKYNVSYLTVRKAVGELVEEGILYRLHGQGTFISRPGSKKSKVGRIMLCLQSWANLSNPYYAEILQSIEEAASGKDYSLVISNFEPHISGSNAISVRGSKLEVDGIIMPAPRKYAEIKKLSQFIPVVVFGDWIEKGVFPNVYVDSCKAEQEILEHLHCCGHRKIGVILHKYEKNNSGASRYDVYCRFHRKMGMGFDEKYVFSHDCSRMGGGFAGAEHFTSLKQMPTAIVCHTDSVAAEAIMRLQEKGVNVPGDISVFGYNNNQIASMVYPGISTVDTHTRETGRACFELLMSVLGGGEDINANRAVEIQSEIIIRGSTRILNEDREGR